MLQKGGKAKQQFIDATDKTMYNDFVGFRIFRHEKEDNFGPRRTHTSGICKDWRTEQAVQKKGNRKYGTV